MTPTAIREAAVLAALVRKVAQLPTTSPRFVLEAAADAIGWQKVMVLRALEGKSLQKAMALEGKP